ncbi:MAG: hypothetical protein ACLRWQ_14080 [Flavonifractor plautii]
MTASGKHRPMGARELVLLALLGALLLVTSWPWPGFAQYRAGFSPV